MANPITSIFAAVAKAFGSVSNVVDTTASAADAGMAALSLHAAEYKKRVEYDYINDFNIYKLEKEQADRERMIKVIAERNKLVAKMNELDEVKPEEIAGLDLVFKEELDRASKL